MFITLRNATKKYGEGESLVYALDHADLEIEKGEVCVILGPSGSGKSTLLNMLGGLDHLDEGEIVVGERNLSGYKNNMLTDYRKEDVGFVFQFYNLIPDLTVAENIEVVSDIVENPLNIDEVLEALGMEKYRYRFPKELSGGQQQWAAIARAIIKNPKLLLCDELTGALDTKSSKTVLELIEKINQLYETTTRLNDGYYITSVMAMLQDVQAGDRIILCNPLTMEEFGITVAGVLDNDMQNAVFSNKEDVAGIMGIDENASNVVMSDMELDIQDSRIIQTIKKEDAREQFQNMSNQMNVMVYFLIGI